MITFSQVCNYSLISFISKSYTYGYHYLDSYLSIEVEIITTLSSDKFETSSQQQSVIKTGSIYASDKYKNVYQYLDN